MAINNTALTTTASSIYTSTGSSAITTIHLCNYSGSTVTVDLYAVPNGSSAANATIIYSNVEITSTNTYFISQEKFILSNGDALYAKASSDSAVTATVSSIGI